MLSKALYEGPGGGSLTAIPAVYLYAATALEQSSHISICGGGSRQLVALKVRVVGGVDEVVGQGLRHVLMGEGARGWS